MATWNVILLVDRPHGAVRGEDLDRAAAEAFELMADLERELSKFDPEPGPPEHRQARVDLIAAVAEAVKKGAAPPAPKPAKR